MGSTLTAAIGRATAAGIDTLIRTIGRRVARDGAPWLDCPLGRPGKIGGEFYARLAADENLTVAPGGDHGLLTDFDALRGPGFDPDAVCDAVRHFYEHTARYRLEAWSEAPIPTRFFLWWLTTFVSRPMDQLNFPVSSLELAGGMTSEVIPLLDAAGDRVHTGWLRRRTADGRVVYTGLYSVERPGGGGPPCVKVSFPVPNGSATVFLRPEARPDGSFRLLSRGRRFGDPGFYRMVRSGPDHWRVRYFRSLHEEFHVHVDDRGELRTEHAVRFLGMTTLRLHYKIEERPADAAG